MGPPYRLLKAAARPRNLSWAPVVAFCCCQARNLSCAPLYRLLMLLPGPGVCHGPPCTDSSCCCKPVICSWAPVLPPHAAARSRVCHGSPVRPPIAAAARPVICHGPPLPNPHAAARPLISVMGPCTASSCCCQ
ncbi:unnamed protein product, partial [Staurois parvus]